MSIVFDPHYVIAENISRSSRYVQFALKCPEQEETYISEQMLIGNSVSNIILNGVASFLGDNYRKRKLLKEACEKAVCRAVCEIRNKFNCETCCSDRGCDASFLGFAHVQLGAQLDSESLTRKYLPIHFIGFPQVIDCI